MKYRFMVAHRGEHRVEKMARNLGVTRSGFYAWMRRGKAARREHDERLMASMMRIQREVKYRYGSPRIVFNRPGLPVKIAGRRLAQKRL